MTIIAGSDGSHVAFEIDGERVNIDEIPEAMRDYSNAAASTLAVGYTMGKTTKSVSDTCEKLLVKLEGQVEKDIESLQDDVKGVESSVASTVSAVDAKMVLVDTKLADSQKEISATVDTTVKKLQFDVTAQLKSTSDYVEKAKACGANGQGVAVKGGNLECSDVTPTADEDAECDASNEGKISVRARKVGDHTWNTVNVCVAKKWEVLSQIIPQVVREYGTSASKKAKTCKHILDTNPEAMSGKYYVSQHNNAIYPVYCEMDTAYKGGGWQLLLTLTHPFRMFSGSRHPLGYTDINAKAPDPNREYARRWNNVNKPGIGDEFLIRASDGRWKTFTMTATFCGWSSRDSGVCNGCHGTYAKGQIYNEDGSKVNCGGAGCWLNSCSVCGGCNSHGCDTIGFNADHGDYNTRGGGSNWATFGSGWEAPMDGHNCGGGWGRKHDNSVFPLNLFYRRKQ